MILGIGSDIISVSRVKSLAINSNGKVFARILAKDEILKLDDDLKSQKNIAFLAKRFAAKEAVAKAIGTGFSNTIFPKDIEILRNSAGKPYINAQANLEEVFSDLRIINSHVSIADEIDYVVAFVIIEVWIK